MTRTQTLKILHTGDQDVHITSSFSLLNLTRSFLGAFLLRGGVGVGGWAVIDGGRFLWLSA